MLSFLYLYTVQVRPYERNPSCNSPFHVKQKYAWNARAFQLGYTFVRGNAPFPYISMGQYVNFRARTMSRLTRCPNTTNINRKFNLSLTSCKLLCLLKMIVHEATVRQKHLYLTAKIVCSTTKQKSKPFTGLAIKLEVEKYCLTCLLIVFEDAFVPSKPSG